jgi:hypothetical protein
MDPSATKEEVGAKTPAEAGKDKKNSASKPTGSPTWLTFAKRDFLAGEGTGVDVDTRRGKDKGNLPEKAQQAEITEEVKERYSLFLKDHLNALLRLYNDNRGAFDQIAADQNHAYEKALLDRLTDVSDETNSQRSLNAAKIEDFLKTAEGLMLTTQLLEQQTSYQLFALGLDLSVNPRGNRRVSGVVDRRESLLGIQFRQTPRTETTYRGNDEGAIRRFVDDNLRPFFDEVTQQVNGRYWGSEALTRLRTLGILSSIQLGLGMGAVALERHGVMNPILLVLGIAGVAIPVGLRELLKQGEQLILRQNSQTLQSLQGSKTEKLYLRSLYQINLDDFQANDGAVELVPGRSPQTNIDINLTKKNLLGSILTRWRFYESIGVDPKKLDTLPEQFIFNPECDKTPEQTGTWFEQEILNDYNRRVTPADTPEQRLKKFRAARAGVINRHLERLTSREKTTTTRSYNLEQIGKQISARESSTPVVKEAQKLAQNRKEALEARKAKAQEEQQNYPSTVQAQEQVSNLETELQRIALQLEKEHSITTIKTDSAEKIADLSKTAREKLNGTTTGLKKQLADKQKEKLDVMQKLYREARAEFATFAATQLQPNLQKNYSVDKELERIGPSIDKYLTNLFDFQIQDLTQQITSLENLSTELRTLEPKYSEAKQTLLKAEQDLVEKTPKRLDACQSSFNELTGVSTVNGGTVITNNDLLTKSVEEVYRIITITNPVYNYSLLTEESRDALREKILQAKAEAVFRDELAWSKGKPSEHIAFIKVITINGGSLITPNQLLTWPKTRLLSIVASLPSQDSHIPGPLQPIISSTELDLAINEAKRRQRIITQIYQAEEIRQIDEQIALAEKAMKVDFAAELRVLKATETAMKRQGVIFNSVAEICRQPALYCSVEKTNGTGVEGFTDSEKAADCEQGYVAFLNLLFGYQSERVERDSKFSDLMQVLPPQELANWLNAEFNLVTGNNAVTLNSVLTSLSTRLQGGRRKIYPIDLQQGLSRIVERLNRRTESYS